MPAPKNERMDALTEAILRLLKRQEETERRLARIEEFLNISVAEPPPPAAEAEPAPALPETARTPPHEIDQKEPARPREFETRMGLTWINRVGVITLLLGVAFFFKYAVENQWIGEKGRVVLGVAAGFSGLVLADRIWRGGQRIYAQGISGAGIAILYISYYAAFGLYGLIAMPPAFLLMALTTAGAGALSIRYDAMAIAALGLFGGYLTPLLLSSGQERPWFLFSYVLLLDVGARTVAGRRNWRGLEVLAFLATIALYGSWFVSWYGTEEQVVATVFALVFYALFASLNREVIFGISQIIAALVLSSIWSPSLAPFLLLSLGLLITGLIVTAWREWKHGLLAVFGAFWCSFALWEQSSIQTRPLGPVFLFLTVAFLLFLAWTPWRALGRKSTLRRQDLFLLTLNGAVYFSFCYRLLEPDYRAYLGLFAVALAAVYMLLGSQLWNQHGHNEFPSLLCVAIAWIFLTLAVPIQFSGYRITTAWALEAAALAWIGVRTREVRVVYAALGVFCLMLCRLYFFDARIYASAAAYTAIANPRFLTFATAAISFWAAAYWIERSAKVMRPIALAKYIAGHVVMLSALCLETSGWAARNSELENLRSVESTSISILMAAYAVLLVGIGVFTRSAIDRILGLGLIAVVVTKLYLYDVWLLGRVYRIAAFITLSALLLLMSYLYSRYRASIESWWQDQRTG